jgi:hypothetical protein
MVAHAKEALEDATAEASAELRAQPQSAENGTAAVSGEKVAPPAAVELAAAMGSRKGVGSA